MPGSVDRPPDLVRELRGMKANVAELRNSAPRLPVVTVVVAAVQSIPNGSNTAVTFALVEVDTAGAWDAGTPTLLTIPRDGVYNLSGTVQFDLDAGAGLREVLISTSAHGAILGANGTTTAALEWRSTVSSPVVLSAGNTVQMIVFQGSGGPLDLNIGRLGITWLGSAPS